MNFSATWNSLRGAGNGTSQSKPDASDALSSSSDAKSSSDSCNTFTEIWSPSLSTASRPTTHWKFSQCFGEKEEIPLNELQEVDIISTLEFDETGRFLATGDCGGRAVVFERDLTKTACDYKFYAEFQSHEAEFDYLKSLEIEEKINKIKWVRKSSSAHFLLTTNDKTIKLWKISDKAHYDVIENNYLMHRQSKLNGLSRPYDAADSLDSSKLKLPKLHVHARAAVPQLKRVYGNAHAYHVHSISVNNCHGESFLSADDLRINLWNINDDQNSFNIVDIKPANMEELSEVITCAEFCPVSSSQLMYSTSKGVIRLCDMRKSALCDASLELSDPASVPMTYFSFSEIVSSISDAKFSKDGRFICARDYMALKVWDLRMTERPLITIPVHEALVPKLSTLYEQDSIFDKFECSFNGASTQVMTGSYNNFLHIYDLQSASIAEDSSLRERHVSLLADKSIFLHKVNAVYYPYRIPGTGTMARASPPSAKMETTTLTGKKKQKDLLTETELAVDPSADSLVNADNLDASKKILHAVWHPQENTMAIASLNNLFIFSEPQAR